MFEVAAELAVFALAFIAALAVYAVLSVRDALARAESNADWRALEDELESAP